MYVRFPQVHGMSEEETAHAAVHVWRSEGNSGVSYLLPPFCRFQGSNSG